MTKSSNFYQKDLFIEEKKKNQLFPISKVDTYAYSLL